ncbi:MAG: hypothetical protein Q8L99_08500 [Polycyclovorans sp.]|nr:hypothetical protein [Polycyclovorans sp.]
MTAHYSATLPLRIQSAANLREHWAVRSKRVKSERLAALALSITLPLPVVVTLTRIAPRPLDDDNMIGGFKALRDGIADRLGVADNDPRVKWTYGQERGKRYAVRVEVTPMEPA